MRSAGLWAFVQQMQKALQVLTALQFTAYYYPPNAVVNDGDSFDFIVVGAGTAGCVVANRLSRNPAVNVLLVEAGDDAPLESVLPGPIYLLKRSVHEWNYHAEPDKYFGKCHQHPYFEMTLGKMLGGTSALNYMIYERGTPQDFNSWAETVNDPTWKWENVLPFYEKSASYEDPSNGISTDVKKEYLRYTKSEGNVSNLFDAYAELGNKIEDPTDGATNTYYKLKLTTTHGKRHSSATSFLENITERENLKVLKNTHVNKILFDDKKNAIGIEVVTKDGKTFTLKVKNEIVVSAGAVNTPKLLMLSGIGPKKHLDEMKINVISDLPVGKNLQDQVTASVVHNMEKLNKPIPPFNPNKYPSTGVGGFVTLDKAKGGRDYQTVSFLAQSRAVRAFCVLVTLYKDEICDDLYDSGLGRRQIYNEVIKLHPKSRGSVTLRSADPADPPLIDPGYFQNPEDLEDIGRYLEHFSHVMNTTSYRSIDAQFGVPQNVNCGEMIQDSVEYWKCYATCMVTGLSYFTSSCAMGSVLDSKLRVLGVQKLRVADASAMPAAVSASPYGTVVMIGEKIADFIIQEYKL